VSSDILAEIITIQDVKPTILLPVDTHTDIGASMETSLFTL